jgi:hypothetical protein
MKLDERLCRWCRQSEWHHYPVSNLCSLRFAPGHRYEPMEEIEAKPLTEAVQ